MNAEPQHSERRPLRDRRETVLRWTARGLAIAGAVATVVGIAVLVRPGAPTFTVAGDADGSTTVSVSSTAAILSVNAALTRAGAHVKVVPLTKECTPLENGQLYGGTDWSAPTINSDESVTVGRVPTGYTVVLTLGNYPWTPLGSHAIAPVRDPAPSCFRSLDDDPVRQH